MAERLIANTSAPMRHPWPEDCHVQGGARGVVFRGDQPYRTAFVEAFPGTFLRGEGPTIAAAEDAAWAKYQALAACPAFPNHGPFEARQYRNGAGFCTQCGGWFAKVLPGQPEDPTAEPQLVDALFSGDRSALITVLTAMANVDRLPAKDLPEPAEED